MSFSVNKKELRIFCSRTLNTNENNHSFINGVSMEGYINLLFTNCSKFLKYNNMTKYLCF